MISQAAEYALRAALCLAGRAPAAVTTRQLADAASLPLGYLAKVMQTLVRAHLVRSQRGLNGGFVLARPAEAVTLLDVVRAVEPSRRIATCPLGNPAHATNLCPLHRRLDDAAAEVERLLSATTLAQLADESHTHDLFCRESRSSESTSDRPGCIRLPVIAKAV